MTVGRLSEREALASFLDDLESGPSALLLEGEPGIGKTTLWTEGADLAHARGLRVLSSRPTGSDAELSFVGLADLLRDAPRESFAALPAPQREALEASLLRRPTGRPPDPRAVSIATLGVLVALAEESHLVVAIDDVQWLDAATGRVLAFAARRLSGEAVGFLLARSDVEAPVPLDLADAIEADRLRRVLLGSVGEDDLATLLRERVGISLSMSEVRRLADMSGGNPFFALEIAQAAARGDQGVTGQALPIPRNLRDDLVMRRLGSLQSASVDLLLVAAAAGRPTLDLLRAAGGGDQLAARLQPAVDAEVISIGGADVRFSHPLYRSALYANASRARRHAIHRQLADLTSDVEERARHLALSADGSDDAIAGELDHAADLARDRGAPDVAADLLEHAIRLTPTASPRNARRRRLEASDLRVSAGDADLAAGHAHEALRLSSQGPERAEALRRVASVDLERGALADALRTLTAAADEAGSDDRVAAEVQRDLAELAYRGGDLALADHHARIATELAAELGDDDFVLAARTTRSRIALLRGEPDDALASAIAPDGAGYTADRLELVLADAHLFASEHDGARDRLERLLRSATDRGDEPSRRVALVRLAEVEIRDGSWDRAGSFAEEAVALAGRLGLEQGLELGLLAYLDALRGRADEARAGADRGLRQAGHDRPALLWNLGALGALELSLGQTDVALRHLGRAGGVAAEMGIDEPAALPFLADEPEALVAAGERASAERRIAWLEERGAALGRGSVLAAAARCRGLLQADSGELGGALDSVESSVERLGGLPLPLERGRSLLVLGTLRRRDRQKRGAREALEGALEVFEALGASIWSTRAREELARISGRRAAVTELTDAEQRVVRLAASGRTNREIARTLSMSVRTVEGHLSHAYAKLGLRSRTELAVFIDRSDSP